MGTLQIVERTRETWRVHGPRAGMYDAQVRALNRVVGVEILKGMAVTLGDVTDASLFEAPGYEGRFATPAELAPFASDPALELSAEFLARAQARGDRCYALFAGRELAAYGWYSSVPTPIDDTFVLHFDRAYMYMYKGYTAPAHREELLHPVGICRALRAFTAEGKRGLVSYVHANNFAARKAGASIGYRTFGELYLMRLGASSFAYASRGCHAYGFTARPSRAAPPQLGGGHEPTVAQQLSRASLRLLSTLAIFADP
jgi:hypothetical protein